MQDACNEIRRDFHDEIVDTRVFPDGSWHLFRLGK